MLSTASVSEGSPSPRLIIMKRDVDFTFAMMSCNGCRFSSSDFLANTATDRAADPAPMQVANVAALVSTATWPQKGNAVAGIVASSRAARHAASICKLRRLQGLDRLQRYLGRMLGAKSNEIAAQGRQRVGKGLPSER